MMNKRKTMLIVLACCLFAAAGITAIVLTLKTPVIEVSSSSTPYGENGYFAVSAHGFESIIGTDFTVKFDNKALKIKEIANGKVFDSVSVSDEEYANNNGVIEVVYLDYTGGDKPINLDGDLIYVRYEVIKPQDIELEMDAVKVVNDKMEYVDTFTVRNGKIKTDAVH